MTPVEVGPGRRRSTPGTRSDAEARQDQLRTGLESARKWAGAWRTGLAGLLALITTVSVVKGRETLTGLDRPYRYLVGILLLLALVAAVAGALWAMQAAYGDAELVPHDKDLSIWRVEKIGDVQAKVTYATRSTLAALALLVAAVAVTWYGPQSPPAFVKVDAQSTADGQPAIGTCGTSHGVDDGELKIESNGVTTSIPVAAIEQLEVVDKCG